MKHKDEYEWWNSMLEEEVISSQLGYSVLSSNDRYY